MSIAKTTKNTSTHARRCLKLHDADQSLHHQENKYPNVLIEIFTLKKNNRFYLLVDNQLLHFPFTYFSSSISLSLLCSTLPCRSFIQSLVCRHFSFSVNSVVLTLLYNWFQRSFIRLNTLRFVKLHSNAFCQISANVE